MKSYTGISVSWVWPAFFLGPLYLLSRVECISHHNIMSIMVHVTGIGTQIKDVFVLELRADFRALYLGANAKVGVACTLLLWRHVWPKYPIFKSWTLFILSNFFNFWTMNGRSRNTTTALLQANFDSISGFPKPCLEKVIETRTGSVHILVSLQWFKFLKSPFSSPEALWLPSSFLCISSRECNASVIKSM